MWNMSGILKCGRESRRNVKSCGPLWVRFPRFCLTACDGNLKCLAELLNQTGIDGIESITQPPEGDMTYGEARKAMFGKMFWTNINVSDYGLHPEELRRGGIRLAPPVTTSCGALNSRSHK